ncbi:hypothetical protein PRIPAC_90387 [Pristionchus pacificus]|uniref:Uncharacterized protein n=1 Tax=Pristionchus pacificus TaxID=54126 RepID=A0A2A6B749_PRIPA|nr:hypothetical protein PRIPAC_90387 [Pristionchus pacificus]|eukprot:PDM61702.1 hypothetical protein PRIPAC_51144 [Pristionchus pacificus]
MGIFSVFSMFLFFILLHETSSYSSSKDYKELESYRSTDYTGVYVAFGVGFIVLMACVVGCACYYRKKWDKEEANDIQQQHAIIRRQYVKNLEFNPPPVYPYSPTPLPIREAKPIVPYSMIWQSAQLNGKSEGAKMQIVNPVPTYSTIEQPIELNATQEDSNPK